MVMYKLKGMNSRSQTVSSSLQLNGTFLVGVDEEFLTITDVFDFVYIVL